MNSAETYTEIIDIEGGRTVVAENTGWILGRIAELAQRDPGCSLLCTRPSGDDVEIEIARIAFVTLTEEG